MCGVMTSDLSGGAEVSRRAAGAGVRRGGAGAAGYRRGRSPGVGGAGRGVGEARRLTQDAPPLQPRPGGAPAQKQLIQQLHLRDGRTQREGEKERGMDG